jgi:hypothetical protein
MELPKKPKAAIKLGNLSQKQLIGIALIVVGVILLGIAIMTW